jgi:hypothetical protein
LFAKQFFQRADMSAHCALRHRQCRRARRKAAMLPNRFKCAQRI